ncbi:MAG TPA: hypothetical protein VHU15_15345 [Stellaceae bacterium]|jgi:hypothetical protein|nr:hypothetical protein [Stellaceae bacterium]
MPGLITPIGAGTAALYTRQASAGPPLDSLAAPGSTNPPIVFEPPPALSGGAAEVWVIATGGTNWGGAQLWISSDGNTYAFAGNLYRGGRQGVLTAALPSHADPDTTDTLSVDLSMSQGQLLSGTLADADNFVTLSFCDGELIAFETATLTAANRYDLTYLRRGVYGTPVGAHSAGANFARFGPNEPSLFKYAYPPSFIGQTIHLKLPAFNIFGQALQSLAGLTADSYTLTGAGAVAAFNVPLQYLGIPQAGSPILRYTFADPVSFAASFTASTASAGTPATAATIFDIARNGSNFATLTFAAAATIGSFAGPAQSVIAGDVLTVTARSTDATLANLSGILAGTA